jgi:hypothetical protein
MGGRSPETADAPKAPASGTRRAEGLEDRGLGEALVEAETVRLPDRYVLTESGGRKTISCREAPTMVVRVERGLAFSESAARKAEPGSIFLDGAAQAPPFLDSDRNVFNLDHHEGCVRPFTLATCEQAYILIRRGLNLREREWRIHANEPDLDTVLAIWLLLNHARLSDEESDLRHKILPLVRLEGVIDVHGLELMELACLSDEELARADGHIAQLMAGEIALKKEGRWAEWDYAEYTLELLRKIDEIVYSPWDFEGFKIVDEIARVNITGTQIAVLCRSESGIYDVEKQLRAVHGARLGIIALDRGGGHYTVRQVNLFMNANLQRVYARLNAIDPAVRGSNRWGGSDQIGGSPRLTGTRLPPDQIGEALVRAFRSVSPRDLASASLTSVLAVAGAVVAGWAGGHFFESLWSLLATLAAATAVFLVICAGRYPRAYGFKLPEGRDWLYLLPAAVVGGLLGGGWLYPGFRFSSEIGSAWVFLIGPALPVLSELLFRSLAHGLLAEELRIQRSGGRWFLSWPVVGSTLLYVVVSASGLLPIGESVLRVLPETWLYTGVYSALVPLMGAALLGAACGMARERAESVVAPILLHLAAVIGAAYLL